MRFYFRPLPGFTALFLPMLLVLIGLGVWQIERSHWKLGLIALMSQNMRAEPLAITQVLHGNYAAAEYRRIALDGRYLNDRESYVYGMEGQGGPVYQVYTPFVLDSGGIVMVDRGIVPTRLRSPATRLPGELGGEQHVVGILRLPSKPGFFTPAPDAAHRIWFSRDVADIARADRVQLAAPVIVEADAKPNPGGWPLGGQTRVDLPNNHLQYAATWFLMAVALLVVYVNYHRARGRIGLRR